VKKRVEGERRIWHNIIVQVTKAKPAAKKPTRRQLKRKRYNERKADAKVSAADTTAQCAAPLSLWQKGSPPLLPSHSSSSSLSLCNHRPPTHPTIVQMQYRRTCKPPRTLPLLLSLTRSLPPSLPLSVPADHALSPSSPLSADIARVNIARGTADIASVCGPVHSPSLLTSECH
jgi:hypothetical protein